MVIYQNKYTIGGNEPTGGIKDGWFVYSHGSYYGEVPDKYLRDSNNKITIDEKGNQKFNPEYEAYIKIWGVPTTDKNSKPINLSLPKKVILDKNINIME